MSKNNVVLFPGSGEPNKNSHINFIKYEKFLKSLEIKDTTMMKYENFKNLLGNKIILNDNSIIITHSMGFQNLMDSLVISDIDSIHIEKIFIFAPFLVNEYLIHDKPEKEEIDDWKYDSQEVHPFQGSIEEALEILEKITKNITFIFSSNEKYKSIIEFERIVLDKGITIMYHSGYHGCGFISEEDTRDFSLEAFKELKEITEILFI